MDDQSQSMMQQPQDHASGQLMTKGEAQYTDQAQNPDETCEKCQFFHEPRGCEKVQGRVSPSGWCKLFEAKAGDNQMGQPTREDMAGSLGMVMPNRS